MAHSQTLSVTPEITDAKAYLPISKDEIFDDGKRQEVVVLCVYMWALDSIGSPLIISGHGKMKSFK